MKIIKVLKNDKGVRRTDQIHVFFLFLFFGEGECFFGGKDVIRALKDPRVGWKGTHSKKMRQREKKNPDGL